MSLREAREKALAKHNQLRALHHDIPSMVLSDDLNDQAQAWANHLVKIGSMNHSTSSQRPNQGENLSWKMDSRGVSLEAAAIGACESWYNEIKDFDWINYRNHTGVVGHFTQLIWKDSTELGIGIATTSTEAYVVGRYRSPGNYRGREKANVTPLKGEPYAPQSEPSRPAPQSTNCGQLQATGNEHGGMIKQSTSTRTVNGMTTKTITTTYRDGTTKTQTTTEYS